MRYGTVVQYSSEKGYGFIKPDVGPDVFFHVTKVEPRDPLLEIKVGQAVKFEVMPPPKEAPVATTRPQRAEARTVQLIDRIPGAVLKNDGKRPGPRRHPRSKQKKPTWRR